MPQIAIKYTDRAARQNLAELRKAVKLGEEVGVRRAAMQIRTLWQRQLRADAPRRTGYLSRRMVVRRSKRARDREALVATINDRSAFYAFILNAGVPTGEYQNWIEDSFEKIRPLASMLLQEELKLAIQAQIAIAGITPPSGG